MGLAEQREKIDAIDLQIRELLDRRLDCSYQVALAKREAGSTDIYRADREAQILENLGQGISPDRKAEYLSVVRKIMEASRKYQYGLLYQWDPSVFSLVEGHELAEAQGATQQVKVRLSRENRPNAMSAILSMIGDYGYNMKALELVEENSGTGTATFDLTILGDLSQPHMRLLMFQLSKESIGFRILRCQ